MNRAIVNDTFCHERFGRQFKGPGSRRAYTIAALLLSAFCLDAFTMASGVESVNHFLSSVNASAGLSNQGVSPEIGAPVQGLVARESQITGVLDPESLSGSLYWTYVVQNTTMQEQEARIQVALPRGSAVTRATLWVNGVPEEAAFDSTVKVESAYNWITKYHRDPLLIKQVSPGHILIKAAPVLPGRKMQFRIGITAVGKPRAGASTFTLPYVESANLAIDCAQNIHLEGPLPLHSNSESISSGPGSNGYLSRGAIAQSQLNNLVVQSKVPTNRMFACRATHSLPAGFIQAKVEPTASGGVRLLYRKVRQRPDCSIIQSEDTAHRLSTLWAYSEIERLNANGQTDQAVELANVYRVVSSVSGATVLEKQTDYEHESLNRDIYKSISYFPAEFVDPETDFRFERSVSNGNGSQFDMPANYSMTLEQSRSRSTLLGLLTAAGQGALQRTISSSFSTVISQLNNLNAYSAAGTGGSYSPGYSYTSSYSSYAPVNDSSNNGSTSSFVSSSSSSFSSGTDPAAGLRSLARNIAFCGCANGILATRAADSIIGPTLNFDYATGEGYLPFGMIKSFSTIDGLAKSFFMIGVMIFLTAFTFGGPVYMFMLWLGKYGISKDAGVDFATGLLWLVVAMVCPELSQVGLLYALWETQRSAKTELAANR